MSKKHTETNQQREFLLPYNLEAKRVQSAAQVEDQKEEKRSQASDPSKEETKAIRQKLADELREFGC